MIIYNLFFLMILIIYLMILILFLDWMLEICTII
jgi:hypothetical protein